MAFEFKGPRYKVARASQLMTELLALLQAFVSTDFYRLQIKKNADGINVLTFEVTAEQPWEVAAIIGDVVHNLHSALDMLAYELVSRSGGTPSRGLYFPFRKTRADLVDAVTNGELKIAGAAIGDVIVDEVKSYRGGNDALVALHDMDISDKHKLFIPTIAVSALTGVSGHDTNGNVVRDASFMVGPGGKINAMGFSAQFTITNPGRPSIAVLFASGEFEGKLVLPMLTALSSSVEAAIAACERVFVPTN